MGTREEIRLLRVGLVVQEVLGDELLNETLERVAVDRALLQRVDLLAHQRERRVRRHGRDVESPRCDSALDERRVDGIRQVPPRTYLRKQLSREYGSRDAKGLV